MKLINKQKFAPLSNVAIKECNSLQWNVSNGEVDDLCSAERYNLISDLNSIMLGKLPRFMLKRNEHLQTLSMETILESQFVDDVVVRKIVSDVNKEWIKTKSLQVVGGYIPGKSFVDRPPKRNLRTNMSLEQCQELFKNDICDYLTEFCQVLNSDELLDFFMEEVLDHVVKKRFEHFRHQLTKGMEVWCNEFKQLEIFKTNSLRCLSKNLEKHSGEFGNSKNAKRHGNNIDIEQELNEIIRSQLGEIDEGRTIPKKRRTCANQSLDLDDVLNAQMVDGNSVREDKVRAGSPENQSRAKANLEKEFDVFTEELANICSHKNNQNSVVNLYSPIQHVDTLYEHFEDNIVMANVKTSNKAAGEMSEDNESLGEKNETVASKSKIISRSIRKKKLDKEDQHDSVPKRHKRKKEDKKHKLKKRKKNKHKDVDAGKDKSIISEERDLIHVNNVELAFENDKQALDGLPSQYKEAAHIEKTSKPEPNLYLDSYLSCGFDGYQTQKGIDHLDANFDDDFDPTLPPSPSHESPLMQICMDSSGVMEQLVGIIPDIRQFCVDLVNSKNAFLWALSLSTLDPNISNKMNDDEVCKKQSVKNSSNPLMQAFRQAVEASKKKEEKKVIKPSKNSKKSTDRPKTLFKSTGLTSLFRLHSNLKSTSKEIIKDAFHNFKNEIDNYSREQNFFERSSPHEIDFSTVYSHFEKVSYTVNELYLNAEEKLSTREKPKLILFNPSNNISSSVDSRSSHNVSETTIVPVELVSDSQVDSNITSASNSTTQANDSQSASISTSVDVTASASHGNYAKTVVASVASTKAFTSVIANYTTTGIYTAAAASIAASPLAYSGYAYNPYSAMYPQATWAYQGGYIPGYMPDLSSMQAYQSMALQTYPMMASTSIVPTMDMMQSLQQPLAGSSDDISSDVMATNLAADESTLGKSAGKKGSGINRPPKNTRVYIFKNDTSLSKEVERYLDNIGLKKFDLYNLVLLRHLPNFECLIFIHQEDSELVNQIPGLLRLKRDLRVVFVNYSTLDDVMNKQYTMIFPRAGMVLMDESALIACKSDVLDGLCQFMRKQTYEKGTAWKLLITSNTFKILDQLTSVEENLLGYQLEEDIEENIRITEISQILQTYKTSGIVEVLTDEFHVSDPKSTADYQACFLALQRARHGSCRHFLFVTDMPRNHPDAKMFLTNGIDIMNVVEFMRCFVSKTVVHSPKTFESFVTRHVPEKYLDAPTSDCAQTISF